MDAPEPIGIKCPKDGGDIVAKKTRFGAVYLCSNNPTCDYKCWNRPMDRPCPKCNWPLTEGLYKGQPTGKTQWKIQCTNPDCSYIEREN